MKKYGYISLCLIVLTGCFAWYGAGLYRNNGTGRVTKTIPFPTENTVVTVPACHLLKHETTTPLPPINQNSLSGAEAVIAVLLSPYIDKAVDEYFGEPTQNALYDAKIAKIVRDGTDFSYIVTVSVPTFHGPHNPPYGLETIVFSLKPGGKVTKVGYRHTDINP